MRGRRGRDFRDTIGICIVRAGKQSPRVMFQVHAHESVRQGITLRRRTVIPLANYGLVIQQIDRAFDEHGAWNPSLRDLETLTDCRCEVAHALDRLAPLYVRLEQGELIDILQRPAALQQRGRRATEQDKRRLRELGVLDRSNRVRHSGAGRDGSDPWDAGQSRRRVSCKHGRGLVTRIHNTNAQVLGAFQYWGDVAAA